MARPLSDKDYEARWDAETLAGAEAIKADPLRHNAAKTAAVKMADEKAKDLKAINRVARPGKPQATNSNQHTTRGIKTAATSNIKPKPGKKGFNVFQKI